MKKTITVTIRLYEDEFATLEEESRKNNMTVNSLGRQIISKHVAWHRYAKDLGYICISKDLMKILFTNNNVLIQTNETGYNTLKNTILMMYGEINISYLLSTFDIWLSASNISFRHTTDFSIEKYVISHSIGENFSSYLDLSLNALLNEIGYTIVNKKIHENSIAFEISKGDNI